jgi:hypothetical protein
MMKGLLKSTFAALMICALASIAAFAAAKDKVKTESVTFPSDITVNGTLVKAGDYQVRFNEETGELAILKNGKVKAMTTAHFRARSDKAKNTSVRTLDKGSIAELVSVTFGGAKQDVVVGASGGAVTGNN